MLSITAVSTSHPTRRSARTPGGPAFGHSGVDIARFYAQHVIGAAFPVTAGMLLYGWRATLTLLEILLATGAATFIWRQIGRRGRQLSYPHVLWLGLLLGLTLPAHLATGYLQPWPALWTIVPAAGLMLVILYWVLGGLGSCRVHPVIISYLVLAVLFPAALLPQFVLQRQHVFHGDLLNAASGPASRQNRKSWYQAPTLPEHTALQMQPATQALGSFTTGQAAPDRVWLSLDGLLRDRMPPLEDFLVGGQPAPIGCGSAVAVIVGGLFLLYRNLIDYRIPLLIILTAYTALLLLPVPLLITDHPVWRGLPARVHTLGWASTITFANYELLATPLLFMAFFLATATTVRPLARRGRALYALAIGLLAAGEQLYVSPTYGPYLALLIGSMLTPILDKWIRPHTLV